MGAARFRGQIPMLLNARGNLDASQAAEVVGVKPSTWHDWERGIKPVPLVILKHFHRCAREMFCGYRAGV